MIRKVISYIFIYIVMVITTGCESSVMGPCVSESDMIVNAPNLTQDNNGYYHMYFVDGYIQTFATIEANINLDYWPVAWISNKEYNIEHMGTDNWTNLVNKTSYTNDEGVAYTVLGVWETFVGDTIKIYSGYENECDIHFVDSLEVVVW